MSLILVPFKRLVMGTGKSVTQPPYALISKELGGWELTLSDYNKIFIKSIPLCLWFINILIFFWNPPWRVRKRRAVAFHFFKLVFNTHLWQENENIYWCFMNLEVFNSSIVTNRSLCNWYKQKLWELSLTETELKPKDKTQNLFQRTIK